MREVLVAVNFMSEFVEISGSVGTLVSVWGFDDNSSSKTSETVVLALILFVGVCMMV
jgi:hypothetical protein